MSRLRHADILLELVDLIEEVSGDLRQQLVYYRASVYKDETAANIRRKVDQLRVLAQVMGEDRFSEALSDYDAMDVHAAQQIAPGECSVSTRITTLIAALAGFVQEQKSNLSQRHHTSATTGLAHALHKHRRELLAICKHGSRQWSLFHSI